MQLLEILLKASPLVAAYFLSVFAWFGSAAAQEENCAVERHGYQCGNLSVRMVGDVVRWVGSVVNADAVSPVLDAGVESLVAREIQLLAEAEGATKQDPLVVPPNMHAAVQKSTVTMSDKIAVSADQAAVPPPKPAVRKARNVAMAHVIFFSLFLILHYNKLIIPGCPDASTSEELEIKTSERSETWTTHGSTIHSVFRASHTIPTLSVTKIESAASTTAAATPTWTLIMNHIPTNPKNTAAFSNTELLENTCRGMKMRGKSQRDTLTRDSSGEKTKERRDAIGCFPRRCAEISRNKGSLYTCDEYPFASTAEGDLGVGLCIPASQSQWKSVLLSMKKLTDWPGIMNVRGGERFYINVMGMNCSGIDVRGPDTQLNPAAGAVVKTNASMFENTVLQPPYSGHHTLGRLSVTLGELAPGKYCFEFSMENGRVEQIMVLDNEGEDLATARHITTNQRHSLCFEVSEELDGVSLFVAAFTEDEGLTLDYELLPAGNSSFGTSTVAASGAVEVGVGVWWRGLMLAMLMGAAGCWGVGGNEDGRLAAARGLGRMVVGDVV
ncbi:hypothetical protein RUND412_006133 [Rhizina undulata]